MRKFNLKQIVLLLGLILPAVWCNCNANNIRITDGYSDVPVKEAKVQGMPKGATINASINGHTLMVTFSENLGQVQVEITTATGATVQCVGIQTPNGLQCYIPNVGDYVVTFTLPNGDEYYGEFTVTD